MRVLCFAPHAGIWQHAFPEALALDAQRDPNTDVVYITCGGALDSFCVTMASRRLTADSSQTEKQAVCAKCQSARDRIRRGFHFPGYDFDTVLDERDSRRIEEILDGADRDRLMELEVDGIAVGRAALYEFLIERKKTSLALNAAEWTAFRPRLANALRSSLAAAKILDHERPDRIVVYNSLYSVNAVWRAHATKREIPFYFLHGGLSLVDRLEHLILGRDSTLEFWNRIIAAWPRFRDLPCNAVELEHVTQHFLRLFRGTSVFAYSAAKAEHTVDIRAKFGARHDQRLLCATMSSYDEYVAAAAVGGVPDASTLLFPTQLSWIQSLVGWIGDRPDLFLIVRVHPREFPNKRDGLKSEHAIALERELAKLPPNVKVNWPSDALSIYDLADQVDVFLNAWSTAGKEMSLLGLPVVTYCPTVIQYPTELNFVGTTLETYFAAIEAALADGWSFERVRLTFRWCVLEYLRGLADIHDGFEFSEEPATSVFERARNLALAPEPLRQYHDLLRRPRTLAQRDRLHALLHSGDETLLDVIPAPKREAVSLSDETEILRRELKKLAAALYPHATGEPRTGLRTHLA
ncbi:MAG: hypothetical protein QM831_16060 [Kofleriaceae bacterium]